MIHEADVPYSRSHQHHGGQYFQVRDQYIDNPGARQEQEAAGQRVISGEMEPYIVVRDVDVLDLGGAKVRVHHVPGHTAGSVAYEVVGHHAVFVGDEVQVHGAANGFPGYEDPMAYKQSLRYLIDEVQRQMLYLGHPYRTTEGVPYGVEFDAAQTRAALEESLDIAQRVQDASRTAIEDGLTVTESVYSPFDPVSEAMNYAEAPRREPSPFLRPCMVTGSSTNANNGVV